MEENETTSFVRMALIDDNEADRDYIGKLMKNLVISDSSSNCFKLVEQERLQSVLSRFP